MKQKTIYEEYASDSRLDGPIPRESVKVTGLWTRKIGNNLEILIERDGKWVVVEQINYKHLSENEHSHRMGAAWLKCVDSKG